MLRFHIESILDRALGEFIYKIDIFHTLRAFDCIKFERGEIINE